MQAPWPIASIWRTNEIGDRNAIHKKIPKPSIVIDPHLVLLDSHRGDMQGRLNNF